VTPLTNLDVFFMVLLADDRGEQGLFGDVVALADPRAVAVHQPRQQNLIQARDELVLKHGPQLLFLEVGIHSWKRTWHACGLPRCQSAVVGCPWLVASG